MVVNREDFDCSICPTEDPSTWKEDDVHFEVTCDGDVGTLSFKLDDLLEANWLESLSLQLVYSTSNGEDVRVPVTSTTGTKKKHLAARTRLCLSFDPGLSPTICGSCGATISTSELYFMYLELLSSPRAKRATRRVCVLRALGLLLADSALTVGRGKTV